MNPILKLVQQVKDAEGITLAAVIEKVEKIRVSDLKTKDDVKKVAQALMQLRKEVQDIPLDKEVKKLLKTIDEAEKRLTDSLSKEVSRLDKKIDTSVETLRQEIDDKIPDVVTITERVNEIEKGLTDQDYEAVITKVLEQKDGIRNALESLEGDERLDASAIKNLPQMQTLTAGGGSNLSIFSDGTFVGSSTRINFTGATVTNEGGRVKIAVTGGGGISDGDKGDVTVASSGAAWTVTGIQDEAVQDANSSDGDILVYRTASSAWVREAKPAGGSNPAWGDITGTLANQTDLQAALDAKQNILSEGAFVNGDKTKLDGIEPLADVTDTANVTAAGALMDSEVTNLAAVKAFNPADYAAASHTHAASDVTSGTFDNARIAESNVTQHQAALSITESQISDLGTYPDITSGAGAPSSTPTKVGDIYIDTTGDDAYIAVGTTSSADWEKTNDGAGGGISDGDKGDITVSSSGATWTIDNNVVTFAKMQDIATAHFIGRHTAGSGDPEQVSATQARTILNVEDGATADQVASEVPFTPAGNIAATDVQAALQELDTEKAPVSHTHAISDVTGLQTALDGKQPLDADLTALAAANNSAVLAATTASFLIADESKLDGIEAGADVTDTANVTAAGAVMDSEVTDLTFVKALSDADVSTLNAGASTTAVPTADSLAGSYAGTKAVQVDIFGAIATGDGQAKIIIPSDVNGMDLVRVSAHVGTAGTTGTLDIQIRNATDAVDVLSTKLTIDSTETSSSTAATPAVINTANDSAATDDVWYIDIDAVQTTAPEDLSVVLEFRLP